MTSAPDPWRQMLALLLGDPAAPPEPTQPGPRRVLRSADRPAPGADDDEGGTDPRTGEQIGEHRTT